MKYSPSDRDLSGLDVDRLRARRGPLGCGEFLRSYIAPRGRPLAFQNPTFAAKKATEIGLVPISPYFVDAQRWQRYAFFVGDVAASPLKAPRRPRPAQHGRARTSR